MKKHVLFLLTLMLIVSLPNAGGLKASENNKSPVVYVDVGGVEASVIADINIETIKVLPVIFKTTKSFSQKLQERSKANRELFEVEMEAEITRLIKQVDNIIIWPRYRVTPYKSISSVDCIEITKRIKSIRYLNNQIRLRNYLRGWHT